jgi:hypothetical protein
MLLSLEKEITAVSSKIYLEIDRGGLSLKTKIKKE